MVDFYRPDECKFVLYTAQQSAVAGTSVGASTITPPAGKVWTILSACYSPDVAENRNVELRLVMPNTRSVAIVSAYGFNFDGNVALALVPLGAEFQLFPGEYLSVTRSAATAGSIMDFRVRYIESDLPFYRYVDQTKRRYTRSGGFGGGVASPSSSGGGGGSVGGGGSAPPEGRQPPQRY